MRISDWSSDVCSSDLGYTMWDYESDAPKLWPEHQKYPTAKEVREVNDPHPEGAAPRGKWADLDFLRNIYDIKPDQNGRAPCRERGSNYEKIPVFPGS